MNKKQKIEELLDELVKHPYKLSSIKEKILKLVVDKARRVG